MKNSMISPALIITGIFTVLFLGVFSCSPTEPDEAGEVTISGTVVDEESGNPVEDAVVRITNLKPEAVQQTDSAGTYSFSVTIDSTQQLHITANKEAYTEKTIEVLAVPERDINVPTIRLNPVEDQKESPRTGPKSIVLGELSHESVVVKESGQVETTNISFEIQDSTGLALDLDHAVNVDFRFGAHPGGGEVLYPATAKSDANGQVTTSLQSGTKAGVVQVIAEIDYKGSTIRSRPVTVTIHSGLPDADHFGIGSEMHNLPFPIFGYSTSVTAIVGDKYGNIVTEGTPVYFSTTGGIIEGSARTDASGRATVELYTNNPFPNHAQYGQGYATVTAHTADEADNTITTSKLVLFSVDPQISDINPVNFHIPNGMSQTFTYRVSDRYGNPLSSGTSIDVRAEGGVKLSGDTDFSLDDALFSGPGITDFSFTAVDTTFSQEQHPVTISIETRGPNGAVRVNFTGTSN